MLAPLTLFFVHAAVTTPAVHVPVLLPHTPARPTVITEPIRVPTLPQASRFEVRGPRPRLASAPVTSPPRILHAANGKRAALIFAGAFAGLYAGMAISMAVSPDCPPNALAVLGGGAAGAIAIARLTR
jgi:hypothetical protein